jgi:hypothetical protein
MKVNGQLHVPDALPQGKSPMYPLDRRLSWPQSRPGHDAEEKNSHPLPGFEPPIIQPVVQLYITELSQLMVFMRNKQKTSDLNNMSTINSHNKHWFLSY